MIFFGVFNQDSRISISYKEHSKLSTFIIHYQKHHFYIKGQIVYECLCKFEQ